MPDVTHPTYDGRPVQLGDWIRTSNDRNSEWQRVTDIRWIDHEHMAWIHCERLDGSGGTECIAAEPTDDYSHIVALRTAAEAAQLLRDIGAVPDA